MKQCYLLCIMFTRQLLAAGNTRYVTVAGAGLLNGSSWDHAYPGTSLQLAIDLSGRVFAAVSHKQLVYHHLPAGIYCLRLHTADKVHSTLLWLE